MRGAAKEKNASTIEGNGLVVAVIMLVALNILGLSYYLYFYTGSYKYIGDYRGWPLYRFYPDTLLLPLAFLALLSALAVYFASTRLASNTILILIVFLLLVSLPAAIISIEYSLQVKPHIILYGGKTDSFIIQYAAAEALLKGHNPYTMDYTRALFVKLAFTKYTFIYKPDSTTYNVTDITGFVSKFDYPAMAAIYYTVPAALHINGVYWDALVLGIALFAIYNRTRGEARYLHIALFLSGMFTFFGPLYIGDPQTGWVAPLIMAIAFYDRPVLAGTFLGIASSYREQAIIFALFFGIAYLRERDLRGKFARLLASSLATALAINIPFILASPRAFIQNVLIPAKYNLYPKGFGLSSLRYIGLQLPREAYTILFIGSLTALLLYSLLFYERVRNVILALPAIAFALYYRPMPTYYEYFLVLNVMWLLVRGGENSLGNDRVGGSAGVDSYKIAVYSVLFTLLSVVLVYTGSPRRLVKFLPSLGLAEVYTIVLVIFILVLLLLVELVYNKSRVFTIGGKPGRRIRLLARFVLASLTISLIVQSLYPRTHLLVITPYFIDYNSATSILAGASLTLHHNPYTNYQETLAKLLFQHRIGAIYLMLPYTHTPVTIESVLSYTNPYAREVFHPGTGEWTVIAWKTGAITGPLLYSIARKSFVVARLISGLALITGFTLLIFSLYFNLNSQSKRAELLAILSSAIVATTLFYLTTPDESLQAGIMLGGLGIILLLERVKVEDGGAAKARSVVYWLAGFLAPTGLLSLVASPILYEVLKRGARKAFIAGVGAAAVASLLVGRVDAVYAILYPVMEKGISFYNLYYLVWGSGLILALTEKIILLLLLVFWVILRLDGKLKTRHSLLLLLTVLVASTPYCRVECIVFTFMYSILLDILER